MHIRHATLDDIPAILASGREYFAQMSFDQEGNGYEDATVIEWLQSVISRPAQFITMLAENNGTMVGVFITALTQRHKWHTGPVQACEISWHAKPSLPAVSRGRIMLALIDRMEQEVIARGIRWFHLGCAANQEFSSLHDYLKRRGYRDTDIVMVKELHNV